MIFQNKDETLAPLQQEQNRIIEESDETRKNSSIIFIMSIPWKIYASRALSAWGDRIWSFAVGVFMSKLAPENLRVVAVYGFVISVSVILFGAVIGNWIDRNKRLLAAKLFLTIQNVSVAVACILLLGHYVIWKDQVINTLIKTYYTL